MAGRPCTVCADTAKARRAAEMVAAGESDKAIARAIGCSRMAVSRHRHSHVEAPARALATAADKGATVRKEREQTLARAQAGTLTPADFLSVGALTVELRKAADRLERASDEAEANGQLNALAALVGQAHRNVETRARIAGVGGFAASKTQVGVAIGGAQPFEPFVLRMNFSDRTETMVFGTQDIPPFEVRDAATGQPFARDVPAIVTKAGEPLPEILVVPRGWQPPAPPQLSAEDLKEVLDECSDEIEPDV